MNSKEVNSQNILAIKGLKTYYPISRGIVKAVDDVTLAVSKSEFLGLVGESGSGKSTLGLSILRLIPPPGRIVEGSILFDGSDIIQISNAQMRRLRGRKISMVFQDPMTSLDPLMKVGDHIVETVRWHENITKSEAVARAKKALDLVGIGSERFQDYPHQFSGGMRQRVMIALAICLNSSLIIADEPTTALDVIVQGRVLDLLSDLREKYGLTLMLITHDLAAVIERCDNVAVMYAGQLVEHGTRRQIGMDPLHPYTQGLLKSTPNIRVVSSKSSFIGGTSPDMTNPPRGCRFHPRCAFAKDTCRREVPVLTNQNDGRTVRCFLYT
jgi:oligopeptide/dipeptide ABC transporter ATP-binding protein